MASLLLAHPVFLAHDEAEREASSPYFPLGLLYLASYVRERGHDVSIFDGTFAAGEDAFVSHLEQHKPDVVGIAALITSKDSALSLARIAAASGASVILGGPDPTIDPATYLAERAVDLVVHHEGEQTIAALLDRVDEGTLTLPGIEDEQGIAFRQGARIQINQPRPPIENLDELPPPARDLIDMDRYFQMWEESRGYTSITVSTSRGCPFGCQWCVDAVHGQEFRQRSPESVAAEVRELEKIYGPESIRLVDDISGIDREFFEAWSDEADRLKSSVTFEPLDKAVVADLPLLEVRDSL